MTMFPGFRAASVIGALVLSLGVVGCASIRAERPSVVEAPITATPSGVVLHRPKPGIYSAGQPVAEDWAAIADAGVRTVVNLRTPAEMKARDERAEVAAAGMRYIEIPIDGVGGITQENARRLSAAMADAKGEILIHCATANRAGALLAVALAQQGMATEDALAIGRNAGMKSTEARAIQAIAESDAAMCPSGAAQDADSAKRCASSP
jgi:uncharacterized protein (TIGR01244 family)